MRSLPARHLSLSLRLRMIAAAVGWRRARQAPALTVDQETLRRSLHELQERLQLLEARALGGQHIEALGRLTGGVAHDFNNLLGVINSSAYLIGRLSTDSQVAILLSSIMRSIDTASRLTQHLLQMSEHRPGAAAQRVDLQELLPRQQDLLRAVLGTQIALNIEVRPATPAVAVDPGELVVALVNLAMNARDAIRGMARKTGTGEPLGHVHLLARIERSDEHDSLPEQPRVVVCMADDGRGFDEGLAARAFEPFFTTRPADGASGLGLSQVQRFCSRFEGQARLHSTPGLGTAVSMLLPAARP